MIDAPEPVRRQVEAWHAAHALSQGNSSILTSAPRRLSGTAG